MAKRGQIEIATIVTFLIVVGSLASVTYFVFNEDNEGFVGNIDTKQYYDMSCASKIDKELRVYFENRESAEKIGFSYASC